mmetsp:Transcript_9911/g.24785  ORF Transcript_9911/g.24785 Transcript_9911/m.24785 type:complete len:295 (+) Transcript_9911:1419-2303(+)
MVQEVVGGTLSTFGAQILSTKPTRERTKIGTSLRTDKEVGWERLHLGGESNGVTTAVVSSLGPQRASQATNAPSHRFGNRYTSDHDMGKEARPGPGSYEPVAAVGKQPLSPNPNLPSWRIGTGGRFSTYKNVWKEDFQTPAAGDWKPGSGWLGDAPKYSFHGQARRATVHTGLPGNRPSNIDDPGPGMYEPPSSIGPQHDSRKHTAWRTRVGTASRDKITKSQFLGPEHEKDLYGKHSPAPNVYNPTASLTKTSRVQTPQSFKFGSGDRFSQVVPRDRKKLPGFSTPGPGSYVV